MTTALPGRDPRFAVLHEYADGHPESGVRSTMCELADFLDKRGIDLSDMTPADVRDFKGKRLEWLDDPATHEQRLREVTSELCTRALVSVEVALAAGNAALDVHPRFEELRTYAARFRGLAHEVLRDFALHLADAGTDPLSADATDVADFLETARARLPQTAFDIGRRRIRCFYAEHLRDDKRVPFELKWELGLEPLEVSPDGPMLKAFAAEHGLEQTQVRGLKQLAAYGLIHRVAVHELTVDHVAKLRSWLAARYTAKTTYRRMTAIGAFFADRYRMAFEACAEDEPLRCSACADRIRRLLAVAVAAATDDPIAFSPDQAGIEAYVRTRARPMAHPAMVALTRFCGLRGKLPREAQPADLVAFYAELRRSGMTPRSYADYRREVERYYMSSVGEVGLPVALAASAHPAHHPRL
jgi:hypothetical protein